MDLAIEYLITSGFSSTDRIPRLRQAYDDMENGRRLWIRSQTNVTSGIPFGFTQFILATHYLINHPNAYFMYHVGSAANYGGQPYGNFTNTHWHPNMEINIGQPVVRADTDYWGATNTNRFFTVQSGAGYAVLGREYTNALVLTKYGQGGIANVGANPVTISLNGTYYRLQADNSYGAPITSITLGDIEGAILVKDPNLQGPSRPVNVSATVQISP
jgi:hypothetical protein